MADLKKIDLVVLQVVPSVARFLLLSITCLALSRALKINNNQQTITKPVYSVYLQLRAVEITVSFSELIHGSLNPYNHL